MSRYFLVAATTATLLQFTSACSSKTADHPVRIGSSSVVLTVGHTRQLDASADGGVVWSVTPGNGTITPDGLYTAPGGPGNYQAIATSKLQPSTTATVAIRAVAVAPAVAIVAPVRVTSGVSGYGASISPVAGATYSWAIDGGTVDDGQGTTAVHFSVTVATGGPVRITVNVVNEASDATPSSVTALVVAPPPVPVLHGLPAVAFVTSGHSIAAFIDDPGPNTIAWSVSGGALGSGQGTTSAGITAATSGTLQISVRLDNGAGGIRTATNAFAIVAPPVAPVIRTQSFVLAGTPGATAIASAPAGLGLTWSISGGVISSVAGNAVAYTPGAGGAVALTATTTNQALDSASSSVVVPAATTGVQVLAGQPGGLGFVDGPPGIGRLLSPTGLTADATGIYIADYSTVRRFDPVTGALTTLAGGLFRTIGAPGNCAGQGTSAIIPFPTGIAPSDHGTVYVSSADGRVCEIAHDGNVSALGQVSGGIDNIAAGGGKIATIRAGTVTELDSQLAVQRTTNAGSLQSPLGGIAVGPDGTVWVTAVETSPDGNNRAVVKTIAADGTVATVDSSPTKWPFLCPVGTSTLCNPTSIFPFATDRFLIADFWFGTIEQLTASGRTSIAGVRGALDITSGPALSAHLGQPRAVYRTQQGEIYFLEGTSGLLRKISTSGDVSTAAGVLDGRGTIDGPGIDARFSNPTSVAAGPDGAVWVGDFRSRIVRVTPEGIATTVVTLPCTPTHLAVAAANELMVACSDSTIRGVTAAGATRIVASQLGSFQVSSQQTTQGTAGGALAFDGIDTLYVADATFGSVLAVKNGVVSFFISYPLGEDPEGVAVSGGNVYVLVGGSHVQKLSPSGALLQDIALGQTLKQGSIAVDGTGTIYAVDQQNIRILRVDPLGNVSAVAGGTSTLALVPGPLPASLAAPVSVAVAPPGAPNAGAVLVADFADNSVAMIRP